MKSLKCVPSLLLLLTSSWFAHGQTFVLDPDSYAAGTVLNTIIPQVSLITVGPNNLPHFDPGFNVTVAEETFPFQPPTGDSVFAHAGVGFWYTERRLRMDFNGLVSSMSIAFQGGNSITPEVGQLEAYNASGQLIATYTTQSLLGGQVETMSVNRLNPDIAWAVAYSLPGDSHFGNLDHLVFTGVLVPEPNLWLPGALGLVAAMAFRARRNRS